jgi:hypothetical protein
VCFVPRKITSKLDCPILTTLYPAMQNTLIVHAPGRGIYSVLLLWMFRWFSHLRSSSLPMVNV